MSHESKPQPGNDQPGAREVDLSELLRRAADDELSPEQAQRLEKHRSQSSDSESRIAFEKALRERVGTAMAEPAQAPERLRSAVQNVLAGGGASSSTDVIGGEQTRSRSFWAGGGARRALAAAAVVALAITAVFVGNQFLAAPGSQPQQLAGVFGSSGERANLISFVEGEHDKCSTFGSYFQRKMQTTETDEARAQIAEYLGRAPVGFNLDGVGYAFAGYGPCAVPGSGQSVHLIYKPVSPDHHSPLSLFIQADSGRLSIDEGRRYAIREQGRDTPVVFWRSNGLIYYLVSPEQPAPTETTESLGAPSEEVVI